jgi:Protein of unknown function (DUF2867)
VPRISAAEFHALPLRVHEFLAGVPLHDAWAVDLPCPRAPVSLAEFNPLHSQDRAMGRLPSLVSALFRLRFFLGRMLRLESGPKDADAASFAARLTPEDRARSTVEPGTRDGLFRVVYHFENESLLELQNRTAHAAALSALARTVDGYRFYLAVYVAKENWITPFYMALIDPFRRSIVYPAMLKNIRANWLKFV